MLPSARSALPPLLHLSLCTEQFLKWKLRHNIHRTGTHTHAHRCLPRTGQDISCTQRAPRNAYGAPPGKEGRAWAPLVLSPHSSPPIALLAARGKGRTARWAKPCQRGQGAGIAEDSQAGGGGVTEGVVVPARWVALGQGRLFWGVWGRGLRVDPRPREPEGQSSWALPLEELHGPRCQEWG